MLTTGSSLPRVVGRRAGSGLSATRHAPAGARGVPPWRWCRPGSGRFARKPGFLGTREKLGLFLPGDEVGELRCHPVLLMRELALVGVGCGRLRAFKSGGEGVPH